MTGYQVVQYRLSEPNWYVHYVCDACIARENERLSEEDDYYDDYNPHWDSE